MFLEQNGAANTRKKKNMVFVVFVFLGVYKDKVKTRPLRESMEFF